MLIKAILCILLCLSAGGIGSTFTMPAIPTWYASLINLLSRHLIGSLHLRGRCFIF